MWHRRLVFGLALASALGGWPVSGADSPFARTWRWSDLGNEIGRGGFEIADLDADGYQDLVVAAAGEQWSDLAYWYVLERSRNGYRQAWSSELMSGTIVGIAVADVDPGGAVEIVVLAEERLLIYAGPSRQLLRELPIAAAAPTALAVGDVDADGGAEAIVLDAGDLFVYELSGGALEQVKYGFGGVDVAVGQADVDAPLEIAIANGSFFGCVLDGATRAVEWGSNDGLGDLVEFAQLDGDAPRELVTGSYDGIRGFDLPSGVERFHFESDNTIAMRVHDLGPPAGDEIVFSDGSWVEVRGLSAAGQELWQIDPPSYPAVQLAIGDGDADGVAEVFWSTGYWSSGSYLFSADSLTREIEWTSTDLTGPYVGLASGDLLGDGVPDLLVAPLYSEGDYLAGELIQLDARAESFVRSVSPEADSGSGLRRVATGDLDDDPQLEVCVGLNPSYEGRVTCFDGSTFAEQWSVDLPDRAEVRSLAIADVDSDGEPEVVAGTRRTDYDAEGTFVYAFQGATGWLDWRSTGLEGNGWDSYPLLRLYQLDGDEALELILAGADGALFVLDGALGSLQWGPWAADVTALEVVDADGEPPAEVFIGTSEKELRLIDPADGSTALVFATEDVAVGLRAADLDEDGVAELVYAAGGELHARRLVDGTELWASGWLGPEIGADDSLLLADVDGDALSDAVVGTPVGVVLYATAPAAGRLFRDGFQTGGLERWEVGASP